MTQAQADRARRREARKAARLAKAKATTPTTTATTQSQPQSSPPPQKKSRRPLFLPVEEWGPRTIFKFSVGYLVLLLALPVIYNNNAWVYGHVGETLAGFIPVGVPLAGALGAVTIGLYGVFEHNKRWDTSYNYWHLTRPIMGALLGSVGYMIFIATIQSTGATPPVASDAPTERAAAGDATANNEDETKTQPRDLIIYYVIGFIVGYREETFRELVKRAADIIFKPGGAGMARIALLVDKPTGETPHSVVLTPATAASIVEWKLDFGDGDATNGSGVPSATSHTYNNPGMYLATIEVTENTGGKSAATAQVTVTGNPMAQPAAAALADPGVQRLAQAGTDEEKQKIERELITDTDKHLEPPFTNPTADNADNP